MRNLTNSGIFKDKEILKISSTDIPKAKSNAKIAPADDPDISFTSTSLDSSGLRDPINEYIPIEAGPKTRYFILLFNRIEEIDDAKARTQPQKRLRGSKPLEGSFDQIGEDHQNRVEWSREDLD